MKTFISRVWACLLIALAAVVATACTDSMASGTKDMAQAPQTFCVALDLSDRIADDQQVANDIAAVTRVFETFRQRVKDDRYIRNRDKFIVTVIPQTSTDKEVGRLAATLSIDMEAIPTRQKMTSFKALRNKLPGTLSDIYRMARKPSPADYSGANIWKFLNDILPERLKDGSGTFKLVMLSDCYIELDNARETFSRGGQTNHMNREVMAKLREVDRWKSSDCDILMLPERLCRQDLSRLDVVLVRLTPKNPYPFENSLLEKIWGNFLDRMKVGGYQIIPYGENDTQLICYALEDALG